MPQGPAVRDLIETKQLFHAAIAVGTDNQDVAGQILFFAGQLQHEVVMEFALLPMLNDLVATECRAQRTQQARENEVVCKELQVGSRCAHGLLLVCSLSNRPQRQAILPVRRLYAGFLCVCT